MRASFGVLVASLATTWALSARAQFPIPPPGGPTVPKAPADTPPLPEEWRSTPGPEPLKPTAEDLDAAGFRGIEVAYASLEAGGGYASLGKTLGDGKAGEGGPAFGGRLGLRFDSWTVGVRVRLMPLSESTLILGTIEAGYHVPMGAWDPYVNVHAGYARAAGQPMVGDVSIPRTDGEDLGLSVGDDYYFSALFSLGLDVTFDTLLLSRSSSEQVSAIGDRAPVPVVPSASAVGAMLVGSAHAGLHFDL